MNLDFPRLPWKGLPLKSVLLAGSVIVFASLSMVVAAETPTESLDPRGIKGTLILHGGQAADEDTVREFLESVGGADQARIAVLTGLADENPVDSLAILRFWQKQGVSDVSLTQPDAAVTKVDTELLARLKTVNGVWIQSGPLPSLIEAYAETPVAAALGNVLERGGAVVGVGQAAELVGTRVHVPGDGRAKTVAGLNLLPDSLIRTGTVDVLQDFEVPGGLVGYSLPDDATMMVGCKTSQLDFRNRRLYGNGNLDRGRTVYVIGADAVTVALAESSSRSKWAMAIPPESVVDLTALRRSAIERNTTDFPPAKVGVPEVPNGTLVIIGGGGMPEDIVQAIVDSAGGPEAKYVVLPTAVPEAFARRSGVPGFFPKSGADDVTVLPQIGRTQVNQSAYLKTIREADCVWFGGGRQWRFVDAYADTPAVAAFHAVLERGGVICGSSAGASIQGEYLARANPLGNLPIIAEGYERGFGFLPGVAIDQHFSQRKRFDDLRRLVQTYPQFLGIGIDEATAILVRGHTATVLGQHHVFFLDASQPDNSDADAAKVIRVARLKAGERYDLIARRPIAESKKPTQPAIAEPGAERSAN